MTLLPDLRDITRFRSLLAHRLGLYFDDSKFGILAKALHSRIVANGGACAPYLDWLEAAWPDEEIGCIARELTVTETYFLRNIDQFKAFTDVALPERLAASGGGPHIRVLSAGCASGDEPYSLAIAIREYLPQAVDCVSITALDINPAMLQKAARARYSNWSLRECPGELKARWFRPEGDAFVLEESIRRAVRFEARNLAEDGPDFWQPARWDIVFCRNVLMYFSTEQAHAAVARIAHALVPGGYLFLGHAETLRGLSNDFHLCHTHGTFYYQRKECVSTQETFSLPRTARWHPTPLLGDTSWAEAIQRASERIHALVPPPPETAKAGAVDPAPDMARSAPDLPDLHCALEHLHSERFDRALEHIGALSIEQARDPDVLLLKAVSLSHSGALAAAESVCRELLACDEFSAGAHYVLALCREGAGDLEGAVEHDQAAAYLDPEFAMPRLHIGLLARRQGEREMARNDLARALSLLQKEDASRILLFGGGFKREALVALCRAELDALV